MASTNIEISNKFPVKPDIYNGMTVDTRDLFLSDQEFEKNLSEYLTEWIKTGVRGVWFKVNIGNSSYIPILVKHGFLFHHAKTAYVMLTRWLPGDQPNLLPQYPYTHIGVGGMVINDKMQVLTIQEKYHKKPHWKLPGGYSNPGEEFPDTAKREVFEETGIETEFVSVVSLRHNHQHIFNCSDIYVVCHLKPLSSAIKESKEEISRCQWMDVESYKSHPEVTDFNKFLINAFIESQRLQVAVIPSPVLSIGKDRYHKVYAIQSAVDS